MYLMVSEPAALKAKDTRVQEHWLSGYEINFFSNIRPEFTAVGQSAVDVSSGVLVGRSFGGTGILYNKKLCYRLETGRQQSVSL